MKLLKPGLNWYVERIQNNQPFTFVRYGDGEISAILNDGRRTTGSRSHRLDMPNMQSQLRRSILKRPASGSYITALRETALNKRFEAWLLKNKAHRGWHDCTVFYKASRKGQLFPLIDAIRKSEYRLVVVGPPHLAKLQSALPVSRFIQVPPRNCYKVLGEKIKLVLKEKDDPLIVSISAGPPGKIMAWQLYQHIGQKSFIMDFGSLWDVYCDKKSRKYHKSMGADTIKRNLGGPRV
jgi:hypothetical protein